MAAITPPSLILSHTFATTYAEPLAEAAPNARLILHHADDTWEGDPHDGAVLFLSSDMWRTPMAREVLKRMPQYRSLEWMHSSAAGVDHPSFAALLARGVTLTNAAGVAGPTIAQHVLALMLSHARRLEQYRTFQAQRAWQRIEAGELALTTVIVVGLGGIGAEVARLCAAFGMQVIGVRRRPEPMAHVDEIHDQSRLPELLPRADYVVLACPLTDATRGLIGADALSRMKRTAYLVNVARGAVVDQAALEQALRQGTIAGAGLDVFDREPLPDDSGLWDAPNVTITPHTATSSPHQPERNARFFIANLARFVRGEPLVNVVTSVE